MNINKISFHYKGGTEEHKSGMQVHLQRLRGDTDVLNSQCCEINVLNIQFWIQNYCLI